MVGEANIEGQGGVCLVAEVDAHGRPHAILRREPHEIPMRRGRVDVGQGQCRDARVLCFGEQFARLHESVAQAEPRMAVQVHDLQLKKRGLRAVLWVIAVASCPCTGLPHPEHLEVLVDFEGVFGINAFTRGL